MRMIKSKKALCFSITMQCKNIMDLSPYLAPVSGAPRSSKCIHLLFSLQDSKTAGGKKFVKQRSTKDCSRNAAESHEMQFTFRIQRRQKMLPTNAQLRMLTHRRNNHNNRVIIARAVTVKKLFGTDRYGVA